MTHTITFVTDVFLSKAEALEALSKLLGRPVDASDPANAVIGLLEGVVLSIEVPKFGEDLPLTLDVTGPDQHIVSAQADSFMDVVRERLGWSVSVVGAP